MSDLTVPAGKETNDVNDIEQMLPEHKVFCETKLLQASVEVIDLTENEFVNEFKTFLNTLPNRRRDIDVRRCGTKAKTKRAENVLCMPVLFLFHVRIHQDSFICELFGMKFTNAMLYGTLTSETFKDGVTIYQLDDGTGKVDVYYRPTNNKMLDYLNKISCCEETMRKKPSTMNEASIPASVDLRCHLRVLISIAKDRCQKHLAHLVLRTKCFVIGCPFTDIRGNVSVFAKTILPESDNVHSCELFWKSHLLSMYEPMLENDNDHKNAVS